MADHPKSDFEQMTEEILRKLSQGASKEDQEMIELHKHLEALRGGFSAEGPVLNVEDARMIGTLMLQKPPTGQTLKKDQLQFMIRNQAVLTAFAWRTAGGVLEADLKMFKIIKDGMSAEEQRHYLDLKAADKDKVEKGLNMAIMHELRSK